MNIRHSKPVFTTLFAAIALSAASLAGAAGLSQNEQAAQNTIVATSSTSIRATAHDAGVATLAQNESAAQRTIAVDYTAVSNPVAVVRDHVALVGNERAAQRAIVGAPRASHAMTKSVATHPVAAR